MMLSIFCADIGSVAKKNFGWARICDGAIKTDTDITAFADSLTADLNSGLHVALGFECPLFVPITEDPRGLTGARPGESDRAWSAAGGAAALATGLTETVWVLDRVRKHLNSPVAVTLDWTDFSGSQGGALFVWEAFVTKDAKADSHHRDAEFGAKSFLEALPNPTEKNAVVCNGPVRSLIGAALLQSGLVSDLDWLRRACLVLRALPKAVHESPRQGQSGVRVKSKTSGIQCPIAGCSKVFGGTSGGWDSHVEGLGKHPSWHAEVIDHRGRKRLFKEEFPEWFKKFR